MITRVQDLKGSFISFMPRENGLPLGRTAFQDFEIAYFLNAAYYQCVKTRVDALSQAFYTAAKEDSPTPSSIHRIGNIISELGGLYFPQVPIGELSAAGYKDEQKWKMWGINTRTFEIQRQNGELPFVIGAYLHDVYVGDRKNFFEKFSTIMTDYYQAGRTKENLLGADKINELLETAGKNKEYWFDLHVREMDRGNVSYPVRILEGHEILEHSNLLRASVSTLNRLPYRVGRIRTYQVAGWATVADNVFQTISDTVWGLIGQGNMSAADKALKDHYSTSLSQKPFYVMDILHPEPFAGRELFLVIETIRQPQAILESELAGNKEQTDSRQLEVTFGYEIAMTAADMAAKALTAGGQKPQPGI